MVLLKLVEHWLKSGFGRLRKFSTVSPEKYLIFGIETSCDDTGCAIVDGEGQIWADCKHSQLETHLKYGGIIPPIAAQLHRDNIPKVVGETFRQANLTGDQIDAFAVTVEPGIPRSLKVGLNYAKYLCMTYGKPLIPIHHMQAHALTASLTDRTLQFPFLVLLISGGHCQLAVAQSVDKYVLLGTSNDDAPGELFDKIARRLKLNLLPGFERLSGGEAIELAASQCLNDDLKLEFNLTPPLLHYRNCMFSFAGTKSIVNHIIERQEKLHDVPPDGIIPTVNSLCAAVLKCVTSHICQRVQRAMKFVYHHSLIPEDHQILVVSGGVASNAYIAENLQYVCDVMEYKMIKPVPKLCTDNGVMIAWNGVQKWRSNIDIHQTNLHEIVVESDTLLGEDLTKAVEDQHLACRWIKLHERKESKEALHYHSLM